MRIVNGGLSLILIVFTAVQYNDPDAIYWASAYGLGAIWCGLAALRPGVYAGGPARGLFAASFAAAAFGMVWLWPDTPRWWMEDVWWVTETAREGMGLMILMAAMVAAGTLVLAARRG